MTVGEVVLPTEKGCFVACEERFSRRSFGCDNAPQQHATDHTVFDI